MSISKALIYRAGERLCTWTSLLRPPIESSLEGRLTLTADGDCEPEILISLIGKPRSGAPKRRGNIEIRRTRWLSRVNPLAGSRSLAAYLRSDRPVSRCSADLEVGTTEEDRQVVADQLAAAAGEDRRPVGEARPLLLAAAGRESPDAAAVWSHGTADRGAARTRRVGEPTTGSDFSDARDTGRQSVAGIGRNGSVSGFGVLGRGKMAPSVARGRTWKCKSDFQLSSAAIRYILWAGPEIDNGNPGQKRTPSSNEDHYSSRRYGKNAQDAELDRLALSKD